MSRLERFYEQLRQAEKRAAEIRQLVYPLERDARIESLRAAAHQAPTRETARLPCLPGLTFSQKMLWFKHRLDLTQEQMVEVFGGPSVITVRTIGNWLRGDYAPRRHGGPLDTVCARLSALTGMQITPRYLVDDIRDWEDHG